MTKLIWHESGKHFYESGVDRGVFYPKNNTGVAWNGLISVKEAPSDVDQSVIYVDGFHYTNQLSLGSFAATIEAYTYPSEFDDYEGDFNFCYRTLIGNDINNSDHGYKLHLVYNALATPSDKSYSTINSSSEALTFGWDISTTPILIPYARPSSHFIVDSTKVYSGVMSGLESILYGDDSTDPSFPTIDELLAFFESNAILKITDNGDGTWTAEGPDDAVEMLDATTFQIDWPSATYIDADSYSIKSL